uniref:Uncharacterized protein n=1 Tax=Physcomitrium patens TaxID=3218 RepID=A0A7I3YUR4_PHYPA
MLLQYNKIYFLQLSMEIITKASTLLREGVLNERQCKNLLNNFLRGLETIQTIIGGSCLNVFDGAKKDLFKLACKARDLIEECCKEDWLKSATIQINNKEAFKELLMDLGYCFDNICSIFHYYYLNQRKKTIEVKRSISFFRTYIDEID